MVVVLMAKSRRRRGQRRRRETRPRDEPQPQDFCEQSRGGFDVPGYVETLGLVAAIAGPLLLYAFTAPRTVVLEDDGWFLVVGKFLGVGHPPGYPVHTLVSNLFLKIPWGSTAYLGHLLSGIFGALACGAVYVCARQLGAGAVFALIGALLFGVSEHFWAQAIITEVYTLNALFFFGIFALLLYVRRNPGDGRAWTAAAFLYGLSLANHWPLMVLASPGLLLAVVPTWRDLLSRWQRLTGAFLLGVVPPYAWMVWRSLQEPQFSFGGPLRTLDEVIIHISRRAYAGTSADVSPSAGWLDRFEFLQWLGNEFVWQLTLPGFLLALLGLAVLLARPPWRLPRPIRVDGLLDWVGRCAGPAAFVGSGAVLAWQLGFDFEFARVVTFRPYPLVCYGLLGIWVAMGLHYATSLASRRIAWPVFRHPRLVLGTVAVVGLTMAGWSLSSHWDANNRADADFARRHAEMVFEILPPDAVLMIRGDQTFPLAYYHFVEGWRPDVRLVNVNGNLFRDNLYPSLLHTTRDRQRQALRDFIGETERPVFHTYHTHSVDHGRATIDYGFLREVLQIEADNTRYLRANEEAEELFASLFEHEYQDFDLVVRNYRIQEYGIYLGHVFLSDDPVLMERTTRLRELALRDYYGLTTMAGVLINNNEAEHLNLVEEWLALAWPLRDAALTKTAEARWHTFMGTVRWRQGKKDEAVPFFEKSFDIWPHPGNPSAKYLDGWH